MIKPQFIEKNNALCLNLTVAVGFSKKAPLCHTKLPLADEFDQTVERLFIRLAVGDFDGIACGATVMF